MSDMKSQVIQDMARAETERIVGFPVMPKGWLPDNLSGSSTHFTLTHAGVSLSAEYPFTADGELDQEKLGKRFDLVRTSLWYEIQRRAEGKA